MKKTTISYLLVCLTLLLVAGCDWVKWPSDAEEETVEMVAVATPAPVLTAEQKKEAALKLEAEVRALRLVRRLYGLACLFLVTVLLIWVLVLKIRELERARGFDPPK
jgi:hypothetical protein